MKSLVCIQFLKQSTWITTSLISLFRITLSSTSIPETSTEKLFTPLLILSSSKMFDSFSKRFFGSPIRPVFTSKSITEPCFLIFFINLLHSGWEYFLTSSKKNGTSSSKKKTNSASLPTKEVLTLIVMLVINSRLLSLCQWSQRKISTLWKWKTTQELW